MLPYLKEHFQGRIAPRPPWSHSPNSKGDVQPPLRHMGHSSLCPGETRASWVGPCESQPKSVPTPPQHSQEQIKKRSLKN